MKKIRTIIILFLFISLNLISQKNYAQNIPSKKKLVDSLWNEIPSIFKIDSISIKKVYECYDVSRKYKYYEKSLLLLNDISYYYTNQPDTLIKYLDDFYECYENTSENRCQLPF